MSRERWRYSRDDIPSTTAMDTETFRGQLKVICSPDAYFEPVGPEGSDVRAVSLLDWVWENGADIVWLWNLQFDRDILARPILMAQEDDEEATEKLKADHKLTIADYTITFIGGKSFSIQKKKTRRKITFFDAGTFYTVGEAHVTLDKASKEVLGFGKNAEELGIDRAKIGDTEGYYESKRDLIIKYCRRDSELTLKLGDRLFGVAKAAMGFYPRRWSSAASLSKAWLERNAPDLVHLKRKGKGVHDPFHQSYRGGIFLSRLGRVEGVEEVDIVNAYGSALLKCPKLEDLTPPVRTDVYSPNAVLGSYYILIDYDGRLPARKADAVSMRVDPSKEAHEKILYPTSRGKLRPYYADRVEMEWFISEGRHFEVLSAVELFPRDPHGKVELQFPKLQGVLDRVSALKAEAKRGNVAAKMEREFLKRIVNCLDDDTRLSDGRRIGDVKTGDVVDGQRVVAVRRGVSEVYELKFDSGHRVVATKNHRFFGGTSSRYERCYTVKEMKAGPRRGNTIMVYDWPVAELPDEAVFAGIAHAEASWNLRRITPIKDYHHSRKGCSKSSCVCPSYPTKRSSWTATVDKRETELRAFLRGFFSKRGMRFSEKEGDDDNRCVFRLWRERDVEVLDAIYDRVMASPSLDDARGFLRGVFEGDGTGKRRTVSVSQTDGVMREAITDRLNALGFEYHVLTQSFKAHLPQGSVVDAVAHNTQIKKKDVTRFMLEVGFLSRRKRSKIYAKLLSRRTVGERPVTDISLDGDHMFWANETKSHNSSYGCMAEAKHGETPFTTWPIASFITATCRVLIWREWTRIEESGGEVVSVNTDSVRCRYAPEGYRVPLTHSGEVGRFESKFSNCIVIHYQSGIAVVLHPTGHDPKCGECAELPRVVFRGGKWETHKPSCPCCQADGFGAYVRRRGMPSLTAERLLNARGTELMVESRRGTHLMEGVIRGDLKDIGDIRGARNLDDTTRMRPVRLDANLMVFEADPSLLKFEVLCRQSVPCLPPDYDAVMTGGWGDDRVAMRRDLFATEETLAMRRMRMTTRWSQTVVPEATPEFVASDLGDGGMPFTPGIVIPPLGPRPTKLLRETLYPPPISATTRTHVVKQDVRFR